MLHLGLAQLSEEHTCKSGHIHVRKLVSALGVEEPRLLISFSKVISQGSVMRRIDNVENMVMRSNCLHRNATMCGLLNQ